MSILFKWLSRALITFVLLTSLVAIISYNLASRSLPNYNKSLFSNKIENNVDIIAASSLAAGHLNLIPSLKSELDEKGSKDIMIIVGGVIPPDDIPTLKGMGAKAVFPPGTNIPEAALEVLEIMNMRLSQGS